MLKTIIAAFKQRRDFDPCQDITRHICGRCKSLIKDNNEIHVFVNGTMKYYHAQPCYYRKWATALDREEIERETGAER